MLEFISEHQAQNAQYLVDKYPKIQRVLEISEKEEDDDNGPAGYHYVVKCKMITFTNTGTSVTGGQFQELENTCLVSKKEFQKFVNLKQAIIWL